MMNLKRIAVIAAIAVLSSILIFSIINAIYEKPDYSRVCEPTPYISKEPMVIAVNCTYVPPNQEMQSNCSQIGGYMEPIYGDNGCTADYFCNTCNVKYDNALERYNFFLFLMSSILGLAFIMASIYLPYENDSLKEWILTGLLIGGIASVFIGTGEYFRNMHRFIKPAIIFAEIILVVFIAYKKMGGKKK